MQDKSYNMAAFQCFFVYVGQLDSSVKVCDKPYFVLKDNLSKKEKKRKKNNFLQKIT